MEGVTILNQFIIKSEVISPWLEIGWSLLILGLLGVIIFGIIMPPKMRFLILLALAGLCLIAGISLCICGPRKDETHYQVTISDEVNFNEFNERYEIIEQSGSIYTVREREPK